MSKIPLICLACHQTKEYTPIMWWCRKREIEIFHIDPQGNYVHNPQVKGCSDFYRPSSEEWYAQNMNVPTDKLHSKGKKASKDYDK